MTLTCLADLSRQTWRDFRVIVVDDGSTDGTDDQISREFPHVDILRGDGKLWWAGATNLGVAHALKTASETDYVLLLNNDVRVAPHYLQELAIATYKRPGWLLGSLGRDQADPNSITYAGSFLDWRTLISISRSVQHECEFIDEVNCLPGRGMLIPVSAFRVAGLFEAGRLPQYAADHEFSMRCYRLGYGLSVVAKAVVYADTTISGLRHQLGKSISFADAIMLLTSRKSPLQIRTRWNFVRLASPKRYLIQNLLRVCCGALLVIMSIGKGACVVRVLRSFYRRGIGKPVLSSVHR